ncbi:ANTAR domain-containing protein [Streptomyces cupreus]|uniref:ANTAR domain-containing protein n=1 Tax=Streptomyces cupreus TaxID=2759956 RepID=A0A7X1J7S0_9ACTN|nr:ANTAR domain-containing protein [Streptomyces cupreus]MBC2904727.1 ANTAR domain-containing protein [Streptomyces cupreus]
MSTCVATRDGERVLVTVTGVLHLEGGEALERTLHTALGGAGEGVDLDLSGLEFWDWSALSVLLSVRRQALAQGKTLLVTATSTVVERLLALTDTHALFAPASGTEEKDTGHSPPPAEPPHDAGVGLRSEVAHLRRAMQTRPEIDMARGILMASFNLSADEAWNVLVMASQNTNTKLHRLAEGVVTTVKGPPLPDPLQRQLTTAVATITAHEGHRRSGVGAGTGR